LEKGTANVGENRETAYVSQSLISSLFGEPRTFAKPADKKLTDHPCPEQQQQPAFTSREEPALKLGC